MVRNTWEMRHGPLCASAFACAVLLGCSNGHHTATPDGNSAPSTSSSQSTTTVRPAPTTTTTAAPQLAPNCPTASLRAQGGWSGATGSMLGGISFTNIGPTPCSLQGYFTVQIAGDGATLAVDLVHTNASGEIDPPDAAPAVMLAPEDNDAAEIRLQWMNWCVERPTDISVSVIVDGTVVPVMPATSAAFAGIPRCDNADAASRLLELPIQTRH